MRKITRIVIVGLGGQGTIRAARIIADAAIMDGLDARMNEVHGMAQRGGIVESSLVIGPAASAMIGEGDADIYIGLEPLEAIRAMRYTSKKTLAVVNTHPVVPPGVYGGQDRYVELPEGFIPLRRRSQKLVLLDGTAMAVEAGSVRTMNTILLGVLAESDTLPFSPRRLLEAVLEEVPARFIEANRRAFAMGRERYLESYRLAS